MSIDRHCCHENSLGSHNQQTLCVRVLATAPPPPPPPRVIKSPGRRSQESNKPTIKRAIERPSDGYTDRPVSISAQCQYFKAVNLIVAKSRESPNTYNALKTPSTLKRSFVKGNACQ